MAEKITLDVGEGNDPGRYETLAELWKVTPAEAEKRDKVAQAELKQMREKRHARAEAAAQAAATNPLPASPAIPKKETVADEPPAQ